jgi:DUF4097 and DUF4098 domain-containing protein YvlB
MKRKSIVGLIISGFALLVVAVFCVITTVGTFGWVDSLGPEFALISNDVVKVEGYETISLDAENLEIIDLNFYNGDITVFTSETQEISMELSKTSWGKDTQQAEARLENLTLDQVIKGKTLKLSTDTESMANYGFALGIQRLPSIDLVLYIPSDLQVQVFTRNGDVTIRDYQGDLEIQTNFGEVVVETFSGSLQVKSSSGIMTIAGIEAGDGVVELTNNFGEINVQDVRSGTLLIESSNGDLVALGLQVDGACEFTNRFARTEISGFECGSFSLETNSSLIDLTDGTITDDLSVKFDFAETTLTQVIASSYRFETTNGDLNADYLQGPIKIDSKFGDIKIESADNATLEITNQNGKVSFSGTLNHETAHSISTQFGDIQVELPADSAFDIILETNFGTINTDFQVTLEGEINAQHMEGSINGGGSTLKLVSNNGNINLNILETDEN